MYTADLKFSVGFRKIMNPYGGGYPQQPGYPQAPGYPAPQPAYPQVSFKIATCNLLSDMPILKHEKD